MGHLRVLIHRSKVTCATPWRPLGEANDSTTTVEATRWAVCRSSRYPEDFSSHPVLRRTSTTP